MYRSSYNLVLGFLLTTCCSVGAWQPLTSSLTRRTSSSLLRLEAHRPRHYYGAPPPGGVKPRFVSTAAPSSTQQYQAANMYNSEMTNNNNYYDGGMMDYGYYGGGAGGNSYYDGMEGGRYGGGGGRGYTPYVNNGGYYNDRRQNSAWNERPSTGSGSSGDHETLGPVRRSRASSFWSTAREQHPDRNHEIMGPQPYYDSTARKSRAASFWTTGAERRDQFERSQPYDPRRPLTPYAGERGRRNDYDRNGFDGRRSSSNGWNPRSSAYQNNYYDSMDYQDMMYRGGYPQDRYDEQDPRWNPRRGGNNAGSRYPMTTRRTEYQSGVTSPISSEKFQDSINSHSTMGPMPAWERRKMEKKWRQEEEDDYFYW